MIERELQRSRHKETARNNKSRGREKGPGPPTNAGGRRKKKKLQETSEVGYEKKVLVERELLGKMRIQQKVKEVGESKGLVERELLGVS